MVLLNWEPVHPALIWQVSNYYPADRLVFTDPTSNIIAEYVHIPDFELSMSSDNDLIRNMTVSGQRPAAKIENFAIS